MTDSRPQSSSSVATEAADWYARLRSDDVSAMDALRFRAWLGGDPARRQEFEAIDAFWADVGAIEQSPEVRGIKESIAASRRRKSGWLKQATWSIAATLVLAVTGGWLVWEHWSEDRYSTDVGEQRTVPLADGSIITLNTNTEVKLHYSSTTRAVELLRGQANFEVGKDPGRPFIVRAGAGSVRALGTVFDVYKNAEKVTVTLIDGKVAVTHGGSSQQGVSPGEAADIVLAAGEQVSFAKAEGSLQRASVDVTRVTAWRARKLDFSNTPIREAIAEANRYSRDQIVLESTQLGNARISGVFEAGKIDLVVEGLQTYFNLDARRTDDHRILLREKH